MTYHLITEDILDVPINTLPDNKILTLLKLTAFEDDDCNVCQIVLFFFDMVEKIVQKGDNAAYQCFFSFLQSVFIRLLFQGHKG